MRAFAALVWHEIRERRALLAAAAVAAVLTLIAPLLPGTGSNSSEDIREAVMWVMALGLVPLFALLLGVSFIGRDLAEGRLGFYYAQPLSGPTIWFGKLTAVVLLVWAVQFIIMLPTVILSPDPTTILSGNALSDLLTEAWTPVVFWGATVAFILLAHAVGIIWRSRSLWLVADLVALVLIVGGAWIAFAPFGIMVAPKISWSILVGLSVALFMGLICGGAVQVANGRIDPRRCHMVLTTTLWSILGLTTVVLLTWSWWIRSATIEDLDRFHHAVMGSGEWVAVIGYSEGRFDYLPRFLLNLADGRNLQLGPEVNWRYRDIELSEDGRRAVWVDFVGIDEWRVLYADLAKDDPEVRYTGVTLGIEWEDFAASPEGSRFAVIEDRTLSVYDIDSGKQLVAAKVEGAFDPYSIRFADERTVRFVASTSSRNDQGDRTQGIGNLDVETRTLGEIVEIDTWWRWWSRTIGGPQGRHLIVVDDPDGDRLVSTSPDTGEVMADFGEAPRWSDVRILPDGRIVILRGHNIYRERDTENRVEVFTAEGSLLHRIEIPMVGNMADGGLVTPDRLLIGGHDWRESRLRGGPNYSTAVVDLTTGQVEEIIEGVAPVLGRYGYAPTAGAWSIDSMAGRLFLGEGASLLLWDPIDGGFETVIPVPD